MRILRVDLLGPVTATVDGRPVALPSKRQQAVLAHLALLAPGLSGVAELTKAVWGGETPPEHSGQALQQHISTLRGLLEPEVMPRTASTLLRTLPGGYRLELAESDVRDFGANVQRGKRAVAGGQWRPALIEFDHALTRWRGPALSGVPDHGWFSGQRRKLAELQLSARTDRLTALIGIGRYDQAVADAESLLGEDPTQEEVWAHLMQALALSGRTAEALQAHHRARSVWVDQLGVDPSLRLGALERDILNGVVAPPAAAGAAVPSTRPRSGPAGGPAADLDGLELSATFRAQDGPGSPWLVLPDGQIVVLRPGVHRVGRHPDAQIRFVDGRVSRWHAEFEQRGGAVTVRDIGSTNGTTVDGGPPPSGPLADGAVVSLGGVPITFRGSPADRRP